MTFMCRGCRKSKIILKEKEVGRLLNLPTWGQACVHLWTIVGYDEIDLYPEPASSTEIFSSNPSDVTIAKTIRCGIKLRERKPSPSGRKDKYPVIINLPKPHIVRKRTSLNGLSKSCPGRCSHWTIPPYSNCMPSRPTRNKNMKFRIKAENKTCPMRIAELALPTKRHCIDTWRNKSNLLPEVMIERLQQHVMDMRPVVQIPEALNNFQRRKSRLRKKPPIDNISHWKKQMKMPLHHLNSKSLCILFAQKIIERLSKPLKLTLNSDLEKISSVVVSDLVRIMKGKKYMNTDYLQKYRSRHSDVINKITVWMVGVLEDQVYKQLEEDLRDLEEEEGPVLDILDDLVDKVLNICLPETSEKIYEEESEKSNRSVSSTSNNGVSVTSGDELTNTEYFKNEIINLIHELIPEETAYISDKDNFETEVQILPETSEHEEESEKSNRLVSSTSKNGVEVTSGDELTNTEYFKNEIINLIHELIPEETAYKSDKDHFETEVQIILKNILKDLIDSEDTLVSAEEKINKDDIDQAPDAEYFKNEVFNIISMVCKASTDKIDSEENLKLISLLDSIEHKNDDQLNRTHSSDSILNKSFDRISEDTDSRSKKVMFSVLDMVMSSNNALTRDLTGLNDIPETLSNYYYPYTKHKISFAKPNEHLLSDADELWPSEDFPRAILRPSASVTKSITSLGKLLESDENDILFNANDPENIYENRIYISTAQLNKKVQVNTHVINTVQSDSMCQTDAIKSSKEVKLEVGGTTIISVDSRTVAQKYVDRNMTKGSYKEKHRICENKGMVTNRIENNNMKISEWKIFGAPSWIRQSNAHGEPPEISIPDPGSLTQGDIRKWCEDLDKGFKNLDIWKDWLQNTCKETTDLLKIKNKHSCSTKKYIRFWQKLMKSLEKDASSWRLVKKQTHERFKPFQKYYGKKKTPLTASSGYERRSEM